MTESPMFPEPRARRTDRATSHQAAARVAAKAPTVREHVLDTIRLHAGPDNPFTLEDVVGWYQRRAANGRVRQTTDSSVRSRVAELVDAGVLEDTGRKLKVDGHRGMTLWTLPGGGA